MTFDQLTQSAFSALNPKTCSDNLSVGVVAAALETKKGNLYVGINIDASCGIGFCAEHSAVAAMVTAGEYQVIKMVAVSKDGILPPCGRCRELISQLHPKNKETLVLVEKDTVFPLKELLPFDWKNYYSHA